MTDEVYGFAIEQDGGDTTFKNHTDMFLEVSIVPIKPKTKHRSVMTIPPGKFKVFHQVPINLEKTSFRLIKKTGETL